MPRTGFPSNLSCGACAPRASPCAGRWERVRKTALSPSTASREIMSPARGMQERFMSEEINEEKKETKVHAESGTKEKKGLTRRKFLSNVAAGGAAAALVPRHVLGRGFTPPSDLLNIAGAGIGGMGRQNLINLSSQNIVALCDVDWGYADKGFERLDSDIQKLRDRLDHPAPPPGSGQPQPPFDPVKTKARLDNMIRLKAEHLPKAKRYKDYREMLEKQKDIDAVLVATADHMHAPIALAAMDLHKHVYVQKPLTWSVEEARKMAHAAKETKGPRRLATRGNSSAARALPADSFWPAPPAEFAEVHVWPIP